MVVNSDDGLAAALAGGWGQRFVRVTRLYRTAARSALVNEGFGDVPATGPAILAQLAFGPATVGEVAERTARAKQPVSRVVELMVGRGYIQRSSDGQDRRRVILTLTPRGRAAATAVAAGLGRMDGTWAAALASSGIGIEQSERFAAAVDRLLAGEGSPDPAFHPNPGEAHLGRR